MNNFTKEVGKSGAGWTEDQLKHFANVAYYIAIGGFFLSVLGIVIEIFVFGYANRALKSLNPDTIKRAKKAKKIAITYFVFFVFMTFYMLAILFIS